MGFRFQRRLGLGKLVRFNLSKSGLSLSVGPRGLSYNLGLIGPRAKRSALSIGIPGTGFSFRAPIEVGMPNQQEPKPSVYHNPPERHPLYWSDDSPVTQAMSVETGGSLVTRAMKMETGAGIRPAPSAGNRLLAKLLIRYFVGPPDANEEQVLAKRKAADSRFRLAIFLWATFVALAAIGLFFVGH
jgi:hypothetical protein